MGCIGGNQGIGLALAGGLASAGANIVVFDLAPPSAGFEELAGAFKIRTWYRQVDISSLPDVKAAFDALEGGFPEGIHICVACAGVIQIHDFLEWPEADFDKTMNINVKGLFYTCQNAARVMIEKGNKGSIIAIASSAAHLAIKTHNSSVYAASKGAVKAMIPELAKELGLHGIRVNSLSPGYTKTDLSKDYPHLIETWTNDTMLKTIGTPEDYKGIVIYLASDAARFATGQDFLIDGGKTRW